MIDEVKIERLVLHILDGDVGMAVLSEGEHPEDSDINDFIQLHIERVFKDINTKSGCFDTPNNQVKLLCEQLIEDKENFLDVSKELAEKLYALIIKHIDIPSCDLVCSLFHGNERDYLGIFIFNYKTSYIHHVGEVNQKKVNQVIKQITTLPNTNQKIDEFAIIDLSDFSILLKEKKYDIDGLKENYFSKYFLKSESVLSDKEKIDIINKTSKKIIDEYYDGDVKKIGDMKTAITESIEDNDNIDIEEIKQKTFKDNVELKEKYSEELEKKGVTEKNIELNENVVKRISKTQRLVTDDGIELKIPISYLSSQEKVEFINNTDGTISILLKNIRDIQDK